MEEDDEPNIWSKKEPNWADAKGVEDRRKRRRGRGVGGRMAFAVFVMFGVRRLGEVSYR